MLNWHQMHTKHDQNNIKMTSAEVKILTSNWRCHFDVKLTFIFDLFCDVILTSMFDVILMLNWHQMPTGSLFLTQCSNKKSKSTKCIIHSVSAAFQFPTLCFTVRGRSISVSLSCSLSLWQSGSGHPDIGSWLLYEVANWTPYKNPLSMGKLALFTACCKWFELSLVLC